MYSFVQYNVRGMSDEELEVLLKEEEFSPIQIQRVMSDSDRQAKFLRTHQFRRICTAGNSVFDARLALQRLGIFIPDELASDFNEAITLLQDAQTAKLMDHDFGISSSRDPDAVRFIKDGEASRVKLLARTRQRLLRELD